jgi:fused signal recognition particle receptor
LEKTREALRGALGKVVGARTISAEALDELEEALLGADVSLETTEKLLAALRRASGAEDDPGWATDLLRSEIVSILRKAAPAPKAFHAPHVILIAGVNGTGKTTTIGKLAAMYREQGKRVLVVAGDTFRAAAGEQLAVWAERAGAGFIRGNAGSDPSAVAFDGVQAGRTREMDIVLLDTAGRLHAKAGLMEELAKTVRVAGKALPGAPHDTWLVLDATTGQNAIQQAQEFSRHCPLTGLVLTKVDGTARGGVVVSIADRLGLPVHYLGVGESIDDLVPFDPDAFAEALVARG